MKRIKYVSELSSKVQEELKEQLLKSGVGMEDVTVFFDCKITEVEDTLSLTDYTLIRDERCKPITIAKRI